MSQRAGSIITVIIIILLNLWLMSDGCGRSGDYYETQTDGYYDE